jgi:hypothetical protein
LTELDASGSAPLVSSGEPQACGYEAKDIDEAEDRPPEQDDVGR